MKAIKTRTEHMKNPMGLDICAPLLSWKCSGGIRQTAYQIEALSDHTIIWDSGKVDSSAMNCIFGGVLASRQQVTWHIRLWDEHNEPGDWSEDATFEMAFLEESQWQAKWINPELTLDETQRQPASYLRKTFSIKKAERGRLYITCHGCYAAYLNGQRVSDFILAPGTTAYRKRLYYQTYDVTEYLKEGANAMGAILAAGWFKGLMGMPSLEKTRALITECAEKACRNVKNCAPLKPETPLVLTVELVSRQRMPVNPAYKHLDARTWELTAESMERALFFNW